MIGLLLVALFSSHVPLSYAAEAPKPRVIYKKSETHSFSGLKLKGHVKKPDLSYIYQRKGIRAEQIVNVPENFNEEILEGVDRF